MSTATEIAHHELSQASRGAVEACFRAIDGSDVDQYNSASGGPTEIAEVGGEGSDLPCPVSPLVVTLLADPRESAIGYVLRLCEANGYESPLLFESSLADVGRPYTYGGTAAQLMALTMMALPEAKRLEIGKEGSTATYRLLGQPVQGKELQLASHRICPACVQGDGVMDATWHLAQVTHCPVHRIALIDTCARCHRVLRLNRPGPGRCRCRAPVQVEEDIPRCSPQLAALFQVIRAKLLRLPDLAPGPDGLPHLADVSLGSLLSLIRTMAEFCRQRHPAFKENRWRKNSADVMEFVAEALHAFEDGVDVMHRILSGKCLDPDSDVGILTFQWFNTPSLTRFKLPDLRFIGRAIHDFVNARRARLSQEHLLALKAARPPRPPRRPRPTAVAAETVTMWIDASSALAATSCSATHTEMAIRERLFTWRSMNHVLLVSLDEVRRAVPSELNGLCLQRASELVGLPPVVFKRIARSRVYVARYIPSRGGAYSCEDVVRLRELIASARDCVTNPFSASDVRRFLRKGESSMLNATRVLVDALLQHRSTLSDFDLARATTIV